MFDLVGPEGWDGVHRRAGDGGICQHLNQEIECAKRRPGGEAKRGKPQLPLVERSDRRACGDRDQDQSPEQRRLGKAGALDRPPRAH